MRITGDKLFAASDTIYGERFAYVDTRQGRPCLSAKVVDGKPVKIEVEPWLQHISQHQTKIAALDLLEQIAAMPLAEAWRREYCPE